MNPKNDCYAKTNAIGKWFKHFLTETGYLSVYIECPGTTLF